MDDMEHYKARGGKPRKSVTASRILSMNMVGTRESLFPVICLL
jgi:hypothetical protein